jgi:hypothetical protein
MKCMLLLAVSLLVSMGARAAWGQRSSYDPSSKQQSQPREGFVDFALKQINPENTDYGCQLDEARRLAIDQTVKSIDSWGVVVAVGFLVLSFFLLLHQNRERSRREAITAQFMAQYHNAWVDARTQAADAIRRYNELVHTKNRATDVAHGSPSTEADAAQARPVKGDVGRAVKTQSPPVAAAKGDIKTGEHGAFRSDGASQNRGPEADLIAQISTLQQQLNASHEREKNLQKELTKAQRRAPAIQSRDASLPG